MWLPAGTRIGPYEVAAQIGQGGMGEVYSATDTRLKRQVAIKVLPASVAGNADRLACESGGDRTSVGRSTTCPTTASAS